MTDLRKAAEIALEALSFFGNNVTNPAEEFITSKAIVALRKALAQPANQSDCGHKEYRPFCQMCMATKQKPEQEPVAWLDSDDFPWSKEGIECRSVKDTYTPLYTAPPSMPCEITDLLQQKFQSGNNVPVERVTITRSEYEAALRSKNNG